MSTSGIVATSSTDIISVLRRRAQDTPEQEVYTFLIDGVEEGDRLTFGELDLRVRAAAAVIATHARPGDRALLVYPPGLDFIVAFLGCLYAGVIAVPAYPPEPARLARTLPRLIGIVRDARPGLVLTSSELLVFRDRLFEVAPDFTALEWLASDRFRRDDASRWTEYAPRDDTIACLQYSSGSTGEPRGVMVSHGNLAAHSRALQMISGESPDVIAASWPPGTHDMGLIEGLLQPLFVGYRTYLFSPMAFLQDPMCWLRAITKYRVTLSGGPNFAYDLCVKKATDADRASLDLSSWKLAYNSAEPVRLSTLERFSDTFGPCGFKKTSFFLCYGLAEATLVVSAGCVRDEASAGVRLAAEELERDRAVDATGDGASRYVANCGSPLSNATVAIVNPATARQRGESEVGEIWVRGPTMAQGYWNRSDDTTQTFHAYLGDDGPYLRTGDLGFVRGQSLYVTGRRKDLIIVCGRNVYPNDIEPTIERVHRRIRPGCVAAFSVDVQGEERVVVVFEIDRRQIAERRAGTGEEPEQERRAAERRQAPDTGRFEPQSRPLDVEELKKQLRRTVAETFDIQLHDIVPIEAGTIPKTSSGKIQRRATRAAYLAGALQRTDRAVGAPA
jgi:acyl-CoA synthetase (AMP-forming)/AMP-acid ligase II